MRPGSIAPPVPASPRRHSQPILRPVGTDMDPQIPSLPPRDDVPVPSQADRPVDSQRWAVNLRLVVWTAAIVLAIVPAAYFWHGFQVRRHAESMFVRGKVQYEKKEWQSASQSFHQYLQFRPANAEALVLRAKAFDEQAQQTRRDAGQRTRAITLYSQALDAPENRGRHDLRLRLAELLFAAGRYVDAGTQAKEVATALPKDVKAARLVATSHRAQLGPAQRVKLDEVVATYKEALQAHQGDVHLSIGLAERLQANRSTMDAEELAGATRDADTCLKTMVEKHPDDFEAHLARFRYRGVYTLPAAEKALNDARGEQRRAAAQERVTAVKREMEEDLQNALRLGAREPEVLLSAAQAAEGRSNEAGTDAAARDAARAEALRCARLLIEVEPEGRRGYIMLAGLHARWNEPQQAIAAVQAGLKQKSIGQADLDLNRTLLQMQVATGDARGAEETLKRLDPVFKKIGPYLPVPIRRRLGEDIEVARAQLEILKGNPAAALPALKRLAASVTEGDRATDTVNERVRRWRLLAGAYASTGQHDLAAAAYDQLVHLEPAESSHRLRASDHWRLSGDLEQAIRECEGIVTGSGRNDCEAWLRLA